MGTSLFRKFYSFERLIDPEELASIKRWTCDLEASFQDPRARRPVNLDPGYVAPAKVVLASTKDFAHRIYLKDGIFAEVTLVYRKGSFVPLEHTFPDYRTAEYIGFFNRVRRV
jgi:hypothetical protein